MYLNKLPQKEVMKIYPSKHVILSVFMTGSGHKSLNTFYDQKTLWRKKSL